MCIFQHVDSAFWRILNCAEVSYTYISCTWKHYSDLQKSAWRLQHDAHASPPPPPPPCIHLISDKGASLLLWMADVACRYASAGVSGLNPMGHLYCWNNGSDGVCSFIAVAHVTMLLSRAWPLLQAAQSVQPLIRSGRQHRIGLPITFDTSHIWW